VAVAEHGEPPVRADGGALGIADALVAACSQRLASSMAAGASRSQGWLRSRSGSSRAISEASGNPAKASSAVKLAIESALATVSPTAAGDRLAVLAEPLRWPQ
jgi:hypothetical protein